MAQEKGNSHELPNPIFVNLKSNTIMKKLRSKDKTYIELLPNFFD
jgi:hypothetical protein